MIFKNYVKHIFYFVVLIFLSFVGNFLTSNFNFDALSLGLLYGLVSVIAYTELIKLMLQTGAQSSLMVILSIKVGAFFLFVLALAKHELGFILYALFGLLAYILSAAALGLTRKDSGAETPGSGI